MGRNHKARQVDETRKTIFTTKSPTDLSRRVRLSMHNGGVDGFKITEEAPTIARLHGIIPRLGGLAGDVPVVHVGSRR